MSDKKPNILVVDDDDVIRKACKLTLAAEGMNVDTAENGKTGLEMLKTTEYDVVLLDLMMPEMPGIDLLDEIHKHDENIIVIIITGFATIESAVETLKKGAYDYLPKPFSPQELRKIVRKGLERRNLLKEREILRREREKNLERIAAEQSKLTAIINCMSEGLIAVDKEGKLILTNSVACRMLNIKEAQQVGKPKPIEDNLNCPGLEKWIDDILSKKKFPRKSIQKEIVFDEQKKTIYSVTMAPIKEKNDEIIGLVMVLTDISEAKRLQRMKNEFQKLVSIVAHELKAPINTIEGYLDVIIKGYVKDKPEKMMEYLIRSRNKAEMLRNLIQDLLNLTSIESGKLTGEMEAIDIRPIIHDVVNFMENEAAKKNIKIQMKYEKELPKILGDKNAITYLFTNLMSNAIKYNKQNGEVEITAKTEDSQLIISVKDTGCGISDEDQKKIFNEFYRSKSEQVRKIPGTGLGLSIAKRICELHNGRIEVESKLGQGSIFSVILPVVN